jgi:PleD family two-component response regulator
MIQYDHKYLSFFMLDIDNFTVVNIKYTPLVGNRILSRIEAKIEQFFTQRIGPNLSNERKFIGDWIHKDKYLIIMAISESRALKLAKEFTRNIKEDNWSVIKDGLHITISGGVSGWNTEKNNDFEKRIVICSKALDRDKMVGKSSVQRGHEGVRRSPSLINFREALFSFLNSL